MSAFLSGEVRNRLRALSLAMKDEPGVLRRVEAIESSVKTISSLLELQGKQRPLRKGDHHPNT